MITPRPAGYYCPVRREVSVPLDDAIAPDQATGLCCCLRCYVRETGTDLPNLPRPLQEEIRDIVRLVDRLHDEIEAQRERDRPWLS